MPKTDQNVINLRLRDDDFKESEEVSEELRTPRAILVRSVWGQWLETQTLNPNVATENR